ncbi:TMV resistance protein N-like, partial [Juglans microcarpa x Juglans regia]|uniref:TMV resistance protein N-like n=1 Tax=Juglans microcarpa x Juglans regia TaxID=2249226 RepID=UPI001B7DB67F
SYCKRLRTTHSYIPSSYSESEPKEHDVFLSFRGEDTRNTFTDHLYQALVDKGISTFKDDEKIGIGKPISPELLLAIERSSMAVIVLSRNYASSTWCLQELATFIECMKEWEMRVLPIFYHVDPSDVQHQTGTFADGFAEHEIRFEKDLEKVRTWSNALREVANLTGCHLQNGFFNPYRRESVFIKTIVDSISRELSDTLSIVDEDSLIGIKYPIKELLDSHLKTCGDQEVRFIGLCGMSGIGKTTLARVVFQRIRLKFQACSFLDNVSAERNVDALLEKLLSDMKLRSEKEKWDGRAVIKNRLRSKNVLIVLDDVDKIEQLETLVGNCNWFGKGSRIIITTKDKHLLTRHGVPNENIYMVKGLNEYGDDLDLELFCREAFGKPDCGIDFLDLCKDFVHVWQSARAKLEAIPNKDILKKLQIGFDALEDTEKKLFLDIACFFNGDYKDRVIDLLEGLDCYPTIDIETLVDKSLLIGSGKRLWMHNLLQKLGWEIVRCEHRQNPGKWSRLWLSDDILQVLKENTGTYKVDGIMLSTSSPHQEEDLNPEAFSQMNKLRLIKICDANLPRGLNSLSNGLQLIDWHKYPLRSIPESFQPINLVELIMHCSNFLQLPVAFLNLNKLKVMDFSGSENLLMTPDFSGCPSLQRLIFEGCTRLYEVHPSIGALNQLILLNLKDCKCLIRLPHEINLESLNLLILSGCSKFDKFPKIGQNMKHLSELYLDGTAIEELPFSIQNLDVQTLLNLEGCKKLLIFPSVICCLPTLKTLILSGCKGQPPSPVLFSIGAPLTLSLPSLFFGLTSLVALDLSDCNLLDGALPDDLSGLSSLESLNLNRNSFTRLPQSISQLPKLKFLYLDNTSLQNTSLQNYSNQVVVLTSSGGEFTVINCLSLVSREEDILSEEQIHESEEYHGISQGGIPKWFNKEYGSSISILLPCDLSKDSSWRGIVLHTVLLDADVCGVETLLDASNNAHELIMCSLDIDGGLATCSEQIHESEEYHGISRGGIPKWFNKEYGSSISILLPCDLSKDSSWRGIVLHTVLLDADVCGVETLLDASNNAHELIMCSLDIDGGLATCSDRVYHRCYPPSKILEWFTHRSDDSLVTIPLPPNDRTSWIGLALCASLLVPVHSSNAADNLLAVMKWLAWCVAVMTVLLDLIFPRKMESGGDKRVTKEDTIACCGMPSVGT